MGRAVGTVSHHTAPARVPRTALLALGVAGPVANTLSIGIGLSLRAPALVLGSLNIMRLEILAATMHSRKVLRKKYSEKTERRKRYN